MAYPRGVARWRVWVVCCGVFVGGAPAWIDYMPLEVNGIELDNGDESSALPNINQRRKDRRV